MDAARIIALTKWCGTVLSQLVRDAEDDEEQAWAETQLQRLDVWIETLGVYADGQYSIKHRLASNQQVSSIVVQLLTALAGNLRLYYSSTPRKTPLLQLHIPDDSTSDNPSDSDTDSTASSIAEVTTAERVNKIYTGLGRLGQLAVRLRRDGAVRAAAAALDYEPVDASERPLEPEFKEYAKAGVRRALGSVPAKESDTQIPEVKPPWPLPRPDSPVEGAPSRSASPTKDPPYLSPVYLRDRLVSTMVQRWRRICYNRHHARGLAGPKSQSVSIQDVHRTKMIPALPARLPAREISKPTEVTKQYQETISPKRAPSAATMADPKLVIDARADLEHKPSKTITTKVRAGDLSFPDPPTVPKGVDLFNCPLCGRPLSTKLLARKEWHVHVMQDLAPYICLFEKCSAPSKTYSTSDEWTDHIRVEHSRSFWPCSQCEDTNTVFEDAAEYQAHIESIHADSNTDPEQIPLLVKFGARKRAPIYSECYFCGFVPEAYLDNRESEDCQKQIIEHMIKTHMHFFALNCLPWDFADADSGSSYQPTCTSDSNSEDMRDDIMKDADLTRMLKYDPLPEQYGKPPNRIMAASLDEIRKRWDATLRADAALQNWLEKLQEVFNPMDPGNADDDNQGRTLIAVRTLPDAIDVEFADPDKIERVNEQDNDAVPALKKLQLEFLKVLESADCDQVAEYLSTYRTEPGYLEWDITMPWAGSVLHTAVSTGSPACVKLLLDKVSVYDHHVVGTGTPLALAVRMQNLEIIQLLLESGAAIDQSEHTHALPLLVACAIGSESISELLIKHGAKVSQRGFFDTEAFATCKDKSGKKLAMDVAMPKAKNDYEYRVNTIAAPPIGVAAWFAHEAMTRRLFELGADVDVRVVVGGDLHDLESDQQAKKWTYETTPLVLCAAENKHTSVSCLLELGANVNEVDSEGDNALGAAAAMNSLETLNVLLNHIEGLDQRQQLLNAALVTTCQFDGVEIAKLLLEHGADVSSIHVRYGTALSAACRHDHPATASLLLERGAILSQGSGHENDLLLNACKAGMPDIVELLIKHGASVNEQNEAGYTPLMFSCFPETVDCLNLLLKNGADVNQLDQDTSTALHYAAYPNRRDHVELLIAQGAQIDARGSYGYTPLMYGIMFGSNDVVETLLNHGAEVNIQDSRAEDTALIITARHGQIDTAIKLLQHGAYIETKNNTGRTAIFEACARGHAEFVKLLIDHGACLDIVDNSGETIMLSAVNSGHIQCLQVLLEAEITPRESEELWEPALLLAAEQGSATCLPFILAKASIDCRNQDDYTPLMLAVKNHRHDCVKILLQNGASTKSHDRTKRSPLHIAAATTCKPCVQLLLEHGADLETLDAFEETPLVHLAARFLKHKDPQDCIQVMLDSGASMIATNTERQSAFMILALRGCWSGMKHMVAKGVDLDQKDMNGFTALMYTALLGYDDMCQELIAAGASISLRNTVKGMTALGFALLGFQYQIACLLLDKGALLDVSSATAVDTFCIESGFLGLFGSTVYRVPRQAAALAGNSIVARLHEFRKNGEPIAILNRRHISHLRGLAEAVRDRVRSINRKKVMFADIEHVDPGPMNAAGDRRSQEAQDNTEDEVVVEASAIAGSGRSGDTEEVLKDAKTTETDRG